MFCPSRAQRKRLCRALIAGLSLVMPTAALSHPLVAVPAASTQTIVAPNSGGVATVRTSAPSITKQVVEIYRGPSQATAGTKQLSMNRIVLQPGTQGLRHQHDNAETVIYVLEDQARTLIGLHPPTLEQSTGPGSTNRPSPR